MPATSSTRLKSLSLRLASQSRTSGSSSKQYSCRCWFLSRTPVTVLAAADTRAALRSGRRPSGCRKSATSARIAGYRITESNRILSSCRAPDRTVPTRRVGGAAFGRVSYEGIFVNSVRWQPGMPGGLEGRLVEVTWARKRAHTQGSVRAGTEPGRGGAQRRLEQGQLLPAGLRQPALHHV